MVRSWESQGVANVSHRGSGKCARPRIAGVECRPRIGGRQPRAAFTDWLQLRQHVPDGDLLALEAADAGSPTTLLLPAQLVGRAVRAVERQVSGAVLRLTGIGAAGASRIGDHAGELAVDDLRRVGQVDGVVVALAHLPAVGAE